MSEREVSGATAGLMRVVLEHVESPDSGRGRMAVAGVMPISDAAREGMTEDDSRSDTRFQNVGHMSEPEEQPPASADSRGELNARGAMGAPSVAPVRSCQRRVVVNTTLGP